MAMHLAIDCCRGVHLLLHNIVEDSQQPFKGEGLGARQLGVKLLFGLNTRHRLSLLSVMLDKEPFVRLGRVVGGEEGGDDEELGVEGELDVEPVGVGDAGTG